MVSELRNTIDHLRAQKKDCIQPVPVFLSGLAGKRGSGLGTTLDEFEKLERLIADDKLAFDFPDELNYSMSSGKADDV